MGSVKKENKRSGKKEEFEPKLPIQAVNTGTNRLRHSPIPGRNSKDGCASSEWEAHL